jgi:hypothetical protein
MHRSARWANLTAAMQSRQSSVSNPKMKEPQMLMP